MMPNYPLLSVSCLCLLYFTSSASTQEHVTVYTVATDNTHGLQRFIRSAAIYNINVRVLGLGEKWNGGDMQHPGGGHKVNLLKDELNVLPPDNQHIILWTDSYDVIFQDGIDEILRKFKNFGARVVFSAEPFCWPDSSLAVKFPPNDGPNPFLNSGGFIGYLPELLKIINNSPIDNKYDDQLYYTKIYLDKDLRESLKITLDSYGVIFQNLNGALSDVQLNLDGKAEWPYLENVATRQRPSIVHGNGPSKLILNNYGNYLAKAWSATEGCAHCKEKRITLKEDSLPEVMLAVFIQEATPFLEEFLKQLEEIDYPKNKLHLLLCNNIEYHEPDVDAFYNEHSKKYASAKTIKPAAFVTEAEARNIAKERCLNSACDYMFSLDSVARVHKGTLRYLLSSGYDVIAPLVVRTGQAWSNFWGSINNSGYYARSHDYMDIVENKRRGIWNVPYISEIYLIKMSILKDKVAASAVTYYKKGTDPDMVFCESLRNAGIFMHVSNEINYGHLVNPETFDVTRTHPDIYQVIENRLDWEARYLHQNYSQNFEEDRKHLMPCPDVYWFPLMNDRFCDEWVAVMEAFGKWSSGTNYDERLKTGYEAVPTRDIHMTQVGLENQWLYVLKEYVRPLQEMVFTGYYHNPPVALMNFVVRYRPDEQPSLKPHHDSSTYTINLALNTPNVDFEGGGCHFIRYDCSVKNTKKGWLLMHPGRLTHFHEGLLVTNGTRYIMISFVDP